MDAATPGGVRTEIDAGVAVVTIDRPDVRNAADDVKIGFNQAALGIMPAWGGVERLAQVIGRGPALLAIATGEVYDAPAAHCLGLVDIVVPRATFDEEWRALAQRLAA